MRVHSAEPPIPAKNMSLSREAAKEGRDFLTENCAQVFGPRFFDCRVVTACQLSHKSDKFESRFLAICKYRVFVVHGKNPANFKIERQFNILTLRNVAVQDNELHIHYEDKPRSLHKLVYRSEDVEPLQMGRELLGALKHYMPDIGPGLPKLMSVQPESLLAELPHMPLSLPSLPCHNFRRTYVTVCDLIDQPYNEEVIWDVDRIYFINRIREIRLEDFAHLPAKDQIAVLGCVQFSAYFTGISVDGTKLTPEHVETILNVVRRSTALKTLKLASCGLQKDFGGLLASALAANPDLPLAALDLSGNYLDDKKNICLLTAVLSKLYSLKSLCLADCSLSDKSVHHLVSGLTTGLTLDKSAAGTRFELRRLALARCSLKDDATELVNFVSVCGSLRALDLAGTGLPVDRLWSALKLGGLQLEQLNLSGCQSLRKHKEGGVAMVKELFACMVNLRELNLAGTPLSAALLQALLQGLSANSQLHDLRLNLDAACTDKGCGAVLEQYLPLCPVAFLSLRDNALEQDGLKLVQALRNMPPLQSLDLGGANFIGLKVNKKYGSVLSKTVNELTKLISSEESHLKELILSDARLGNFLTILLNALSVARIEQLDICNNEIGNQGARLLSKALQLNTSLRVIALDRNQLTAEGLADLAHGLQLNHAVRSLPFPCADVAEALARPDRGRALAAIAEIEAALERNRRREAQFELETRRILNDLNNHCDSYEVNGSTQNKIVFHTVSEVLSELDRPAVLTAATDTLSLQLSSKLATLAAENAHSLCRLVQKRLAAQNVDVSELGEWSDVVGEVEVEANSKVKELVDQLVVSASFRALFHMLDRNLKKDDGFRLRGAFSSLVIDNSLHQVTARSLSTPLAHRPNSALVLDESPKRNGDADSVNAPSSPLIHLVKSRPPPPRTLKNKLLTRSTTPTADPANSGMSSSVHSSNSSHSASAESRPEEPGAAETAEAPPCVPRRARLPPMPAQPPRLPPKPGSDSPGQTRSPTDLRNQRTRVLPALEQAILAFKDPDD